MDSLPLIYYKALECIYLISQTTVTVSTRSISSASMSMSYESVGMAIILDSSNCPEFIQVIGKFSFK